MFIVKRILIVEDEANISDFIKLELEYEGYNVSVKSDGRLGLQEALNSNYDLSKLDNCEDTSSVTITLSNDEYKYSYDLKCEK